MTAPRSLDFVSLGTDGWEPSDASARNRSWHDEYGHPVRLRLFDGPPVESTVEGWRIRAARETAAGGGALLSFDDVMVDRRPAFRGLFKYPATRTVPGIKADSLAVYAVGMIVVPLGAVHLIINTEALERGTTGAREAIYAAQRPRPTAPPTPTTMDEYFARVRAYLGVVLPSDDEAYDSQVPFHPLSRVRAMQRHVVATMRIRDVSPS